MSRNFKFALIVVGVLFLIGVGGFIGWSATTSMPTPEAIAAMKSDQNVKVTFGRTIMFEPTSGAPKVGLVIYPGAHIDARSYAPVAKEIARQGYVVGVQAMPLTLAIISPNAAAQAFAAQPNIKTWAIAGHSLGGAMAARYAKANPDKVKGLALWAAYPDGSDDLSQSGMPVVSISGSNDGLATPEKIDAAKKYLPANTKYVVIQGGNHAQFGSYGPQGGDGQAAISPADQQKQVVDATVELLNSISGK